MGSLGQGLALVTQGFGFAGSSCHPCLEKQILRLYLPQISIMKRYKTRLAGRRDTPSVPVAQIE